MPHAGGPTADVPLVTITDHWIQTRPPPIRAGKIEPPRTLAPWSTHIDDVVHDDMAALTALGHADAGLDDAALQLTIAAVAKRPTSRLYGLSQTHSSRVARCRMPGSRTALHSDSISTTPTRCSATRKRCSIHRRMTKRYAHSIGVALQPDNVAALETKAIYLYRSGQQAVAMELFRRAAATGLATATSFVGLALDARGNSTKQLDG